MKRFLISLCLTLLVIFCFPVSYSNAYADELKDNVTDRINQIDLSEIEKIYNENCDDSFMDKLYEIIDGNNTLSFNSYINVIFDSFILGFKENVKFILSILAVYIFIAIFDNLSTNNDLKETIRFISFIVILVLLSSKLIFLVKNTSQTLSQLNKINEVFSPILLTIMVAIGGEVSATVFSPTTIFLSSFISVICNKLLLPIIILYIVLTIISSFATGVNVKGYIDLITSIFKWVLGIISFVFTLFLTISGITASVKDNITLKATKYAISSSIPIIGSIVKDGFDFIIASGVILKNSIGVLCVVLIFSVVIKNVIGLIVYSFVLKTISSIITQFNDTKIGSVCSELARGLNYLLVLVIMCAILLFIYIFIIILSANAFI